MLRGENNVYLVAVYKVWGLVINVTVLAECGGGCVRIPLLERGGEER